jgi:osmotically-inducible protein OsmY
MERALEGDEAARQELLADLRWELGSGIGIDAQLAEGIAVLSGRVSTTDERRRAVEAALRTSAVHDVVDALGVVSRGTPAPADVMLARAVRRALEWDSIAPDERIHATVTRGWVTLDGSVEHSADAADAERAVRALAGTKGVTNRIEVSFDDLGRGKGPGKPGLGFPRSTISF